MLANVFHFWSDGRILRLLLSHAGLIRAVPSDSDTRLAAGHEVAGRGRDLLGSGEMRLQRRKPLPGVDVVMEKHKSSPPYSDLRRDLDANHTSSSSIHPQAIRRPRLSPCLVLFLAFLTSPALTASSSLPIASPNPRHCPKPRLGTPFLNGLQGRYQSSRLLELLLKVAPLRKSSPSSSFLPSDDA